MLLRSVLILLMTFGFAAGPSAAQVVTAEADARGIPTIAPLIAAVDDAVVNIAVVSERPAQMTPLFRDPFFQPFLPPLNQIPPQRQVSAGSGVIVDAQEGYVLTNNHVIENADEIRVTLRDNRSLKAELVGRDPATDVAVLRIEADNLTQVALGNSEDLLVGDFVVAIGNPFGLGQTVTSGIISALGRSGINPEGYEDFIQTDASINPSNSRGALIKLDGKLVGINTAIIAPNGGGNVGIGFGVPINMALAVKDQLLEFGELQRGRLRVLIRDLTPDLAQALGGEAATGGAVSSVEAGTPADDAGLRTGDVIVAVNGEMVEGSPDLRHKIGLRRPGNRVEIGYIHDGERLTAQVALTRGAAQGPAARSRGDDDALAGVRLGSHPVWGETQDVVVAEVLPGSHAARAGLEPGDVITAVNRQLVETTRDIDRALEQAATTAIRPRPGPIAGSGPVNRWSSR